MRKAIAVKQRVAVTLWCLATSVEYRTIGHLFGIARCTVCQIVHETCLAIVKVLLNKYISFPTGERLRKVTEGFEKSWGLPQCAGAVDGSHIPIAAPTTNHTDYYNRKGYYSIIIQALVDYQYLFLDIYTGWPGSVHDAHVLAHSSLFQQASEDNLLPTTTRSLNGVDVPLYFVSDSAYPLTTWIMKPFPHSGQLSSKQRHFNYRLSRARIVVENAFGRLKARWRRLLKRVDMSVENIPTVIAACCILHNMCEIHGETFMETWMTDVHSEENQPNQHVVDNDTNAGGAKEIRAALVQYLYNHPLDA